MSDEVLIPEVVSVEADKIAMETGIVPTVKHELEVAFGGFFTEAKQWARRIQWLHIQD